METRICYPQWPCDLTPVLQIEHDSFDVPWDYEQFMEILALRGVVCKTMTLVQEDPNVTCFLGFVVYQVRGDVIEILNLAVDAPWRQKGCGTGFVDDLKELLERGRRKRLFVRVCEINLRSHLFFQSCGFRAIQVERRFFEDGTDAYLMEFAKESFVPKNRMLM